MNNIRLSKVIQTGESKKVESYLLGLYDSLTPTQRDKLKARVVGYYKVKK
jgi:hypothetical protein